MGVWRIHRIVASVEKLMLRKRERGGWIWRIVKEFYRRRPEVLEKVCPYCGRAYGSRSGLKRHITKRHPAELAAEVESIALELFPHVKLRRPRARWT